MPVSPLFRPMLVGEDNPYGSDPYYALYPAPDGCSGERLCRLVLGMRRNDYLCAFNRVNLCPDKWSWRTAREAARSLSSCYTRRVIALGAKVAGAFGHEFRPFEIVENVLMLPHPSGRCRLWGNPGAYRLAREVVVRFVPHLDKLVGVLQK